MPGIARRNGVDTVYSPDGTGKNCAFPTTQTTSGGSDNVFVNGTGAVRIGDPMITHPSSSACLPHTPTLSSGSSSVFVNGLAVGRIGDVYGGTHNILSGSSNVIAGGW